LIRKEQGWFNLPPPVPPSWKAAIKKLYTYPCFGLNIPADSQTKRLVY